MGYKIDLSGQKFGKLIVLRYSHNDKRRKSYWLCRCECGNEVVVSGSNLKSSNTSSCGCGEDENRNRLMQSFTDRYRKHGLSETRIHKIWAHMKERCLNPRCKDYYLYGGRGISVCEEWMDENGFEHFYEWAIANGYSENLTIDRKNVDGNYEPSNCRWADVKKQANNRRSNIRYKIGDETKTLAEWCDIYGKNYGTVYFRINEMGMTPKDALEK